MTAVPIMSDLVRAMRQRKLQAVLIGNAAAAMHGAPVTTVEIDFMFRETPANLRKLKAVARSLKAVIHGPYYPVSKLYRMLDDDRGMQVDFMPVVHRVRSFASLRSRAQEVMVHGQPVLLASLPDIIGSKRAANRPMDRAVPPILEQTLYEKASQDETDSR